MSIQYTIAVAELSIYSRRSLGWVWVCTSRYRNNILGTTKLLYKLSRWYWIAQKIETCSLQTLRVTVPEVNWTRHDHDRHHDHQHHHHHHDHHIIVIMVTFMNPSSNPCGAVVPTCLSTFPYMSVSVNQLWNHSVYLFRGVGGLIPHEDKWKLIHHSTFVQKGRGIWSLMKRNGSS